MEANSGAPGEASDRGNCTLVRAGRVCRLVYAGSELTWPSRCFLCSCEQFWDFGFGEALD